MPALSILSALPWRWIGLGAAVMAAWLYVGHLRSSIEMRDRQIAGLSASLAQQEAVNAANLAELDRIRAEEAKSRAVISQDAAATVERAQTVTVIKENIRHAAPLVPGSAECRTVGPDLRTALDGLRGLSARPAAGADPGGAGDRSGRAADLPGRAPGS